MNKKPDSFDVDQFAELVIDAAPAGAVFAESDGTIKLANQQTERWFGYTREELIGKNLENLLPSIHAKVDLAQRARTMSRDPVTVWTDGERFIGRRKNGSQFPINLRIHAIGSSSDDDLIAVIVDETERPGATANQQRFDKLLDDLAQIRAAHQKLVESERLAAIGQMVTGLAHESHNALQRATGCLDLLELDLVDNSDMLELTERLRGALNDLHRSYEEVKNYAAPIVLNRSDTDVVNLCKSAFQELARDRWTIRTRLFVDRPIGDSKARVDPVRIKQVFRSILENSLAASSGVAVIYVECSETKLGSQDALQIAIRDNGRGLDHESSSRLFEPFYTTKQHGTGLGLAICKRIVEAHGGQIRAKPKRDAGTVIQITLPKRPGTTGAEHSVQPIFDRMTPVRYQQP